MPRLTHLVLLPLALAAAVALTGCVPDNPPVPAPSPTPAASGEPLFASEEEALAAAEEAFAKYIEVSDAINSRERESIDSIKELVHPDWFAENEAFFNTVRERNHFFEGPTIIQPMTLQSFRADEATAVIEAYVCLDLRKARVEDAAGNDVTPERDDFVPLDVEFTTGDDGTLVITSSDFWTGRDFCVR